MREPVSEIQISTSPRACRYHQIVFSYAGIKQTVMLFPDKEYRDGDPGIRPTTVCRRSCQRSCPIATFSEESHHHRTLPRRAGISSERRDGAEKLEPKG